MAHFICKLINYVIFFNGLLSLAMGNELPSRCYGSARMDCYPLIPSFVHFYGWDFSFVERFYLHNADVLQWSLQSLPDGLFNSASNIKHLYMDRAGLENLNCDIFQPLRHSLNTLQMDYNLFREFPSCALKNLNRLENIYFRYQNLDFVNINEMELNSLIYIDLRQNKISNLSISYINNNNNLKIVLDNNEITYLHIAQVHRINYISVKENQLVAIYHGIFQYSLSILENVDLSDNALGDDVWNVFNGVTSLQTLNLQHNKVQTVSPSVINRLSELSSLDLSHNFISSLTDVLLRSGKMITVLLNSNNLVNVPPNLINNSNSFGNYYKCKLDFSNNMIKHLQLEIPKTCFSFTLNLGQNNLTSINFQNNITKIELLNISSNRLITLPATIPQARRYIISNNPLSTMNVLQNVMTTMKDASEIEMDNINFLCNRSEHYQLTNLHVSKVYTLSLRGNCIPVTFLCYIGKNTINVYLDNNKNYDNFTEAMPCETHTKRFDVVSFSGNRMTKVFVDLFTSKNIKTIANVTSIYCKKCQLREFPFVRYTSSLILRSYVFDLSENFLTVFNGLEIITFSYHFTLNLEHNQISNYKKVNVKNTSTEFFCNIDLKYMNNSIAKAMNSLTLIEFSDRLICISIYISIDLSFNKIYELNLATIIISNDNSDLTVRNLNVSHNDLEEYRNCLQNVDYIQILDFTYNKLRELPDHSCRYGYDTYLGHNSVTDISTILPKASIIKLDVEWNMIHSINEDAFSKMTSVRTLNLRGNKLTQFPKAVQNLLSLKLLDLSYNKIANIKQSDIGIKMNHLITLILTGNDLANHPSTSNGFLEPFQYRELTDNFLHCNCDVLFLRNHTNTFGRCSFPPEFEGYLVSCFPADYCVGIVPIYVYRETKSMCLYDDFFDIKISVLEVDEVLSVGWRRLGQIKQTSIQMIAYREQRIVQQILVNETSQTNSFFLPYNLNVDRICINALLKDSTLERCVDVNHTGIISTVDVNYTTIISTVKPNVVSETNSNKGAVYGTSAAVVLSVLLNIFGGIFIFVLNRRSRMTDAANSNRLDNNGYLPNEYETSIVRRGASDQQVEVYDELSGNRNITIQGAYENLNI